MQWQKFASLSESYRAIQLQLMVSATPEAMDLKGLTGWGKLCAKSLAYSHKVEADDSQPNIVREHWGEIREHAVIQLERTAKAVQFYIDTAEELTPWERCQIFELLTLCSTTFQDEADYTKLILSKQAELDEIPESVSSETLTLLAKFKGN